jgi:hypothetical protein
MSEQEPNIKNPSIRELITRELVDAIILFPTGKIRQFKTRFRNVNEIISFDNSEKEPRFYVKSQIQDPENSSIWIYEVKSIKWESLKHKFRNKRTLE